MRMIYWYVCDDLIPKDRNIHSDISILELLVRWFGRTAHSANALTNYMGRTAMIHSRINSRGEGGGGIIGRGGGKILNN